MACSPNALALIDVDKLGNDAWRAFEDANSGIAFGERVLNLASVEIKIRVAPGTVDSILTLAAASIISCNVGDERFRQFVPAEHICQLRPLPPLKRYKHSSQSLYSKTKGGVDGATQERAMLRSSTSHFKWEQKLISQTIKTLAINGFIALSIFQRRDLLEDGASFRSLNSYRNALNVV